MNLLDKYDPHEIRFPGDGLPGIYNRTSKHDGDGHHLSTRLRVAGRETTRASLACRCDAVIVEIDYPRDDETEFLLRRWPAAR
jgi:hypothetical protein